MWKTRAQMSPKKACVHNVSSNPQTLGCPTTGAVITTVLVITGPGETSEKVVGAHGKDSPR